MPDLQTTYATFSAIDYKDENTLFSYSLSATPLKFIPDLPVGSNYNVFWSFGDGTTSKELTPTKYWNFPGEYVVNLIVFDCNNNAQVSSFSQTITIDDLIPYTLNFGTLSGSSDNLNIVQNKITGPWNLYTSYPHYQPTNKVIYDYNSTTSTNYFNISANRYVQLDKTYSLYQSISNVSLSANQFEQVPFVQPQTERIFAKIENGNIVPAQMEDLNSFYIGSSAITPVYFKDDEVNDTELTFKFDQSNSYIPNKVDYLNNLSVTLNLSVIENDDYNSATITSNGHDGEGTLITSFNISPIKFYNTYIPFVFKVKDSDNFSIKSLSAYTSDTLNVELLSENGQPFPLSGVTISQVTSASYDGSFVGTLFVNGVSEPSIAQLSAFDIGNALDAASDQFVIYPADYHDLYKINEDFNATEVLQNITLQETIKNNPTLYEFFETLLGGEDIDHDNIGTKIYEKIENFVANNADVDVDEITALISQLDNLNSEEFIFDRGLLNYPEQIKRTLNLASIDYNKLVGTTNKFKENFDIKGQISKEVFGTNIGDELNSQTYVLSAGTDIVALEKFSGDYTQLNSYQPFNALSGTTTPLTAYSSNWGWPLVLPNNFNTSDFDKYYTFFEYTSAFDNTITDNVIDFENPSTTITKQEATKDELRRDGGIFDYLIHNTLYKSLVDQ